MRARPVPQGGSIHRHRIRSRDGASRAVRVWLPRSRPEAVLYLYDGANVLAHGRRRPTWRADRAAAELIAGRRIVPLAIVAIDQAPGRRRWADYLPYPDPRNARARRFAADAYADLVVGTVIPAVTRSHPELARAAHVGIGGSSYGAVAALHTALRHPGVFDRLLLLSPPLWVGEGRLIEDARRGRVPVRVWLGVGTRESPSAERSAELVRLVRRLARAQRDRTALRLSVATDARHHEDAWAAQLPRALRWLFAAA